ncbi:MAG: hypothetical protein ABJN46_14495, partial [Marinobacter sp.]|uniref:hypothetical protein n=1 Tax=Marinobacter sp. TaxID=50741 RepID=UPI003298FC33
TYSGLPSRIYPYLQAVGNSDSGKLAVNSRCGLIGTILCSSLPYCENNHARVLNQTKEKPLLWWHHLQATNEQRATT